MKNNDNTTFGEHALRPRISGIIDIFEMRRLEMRPKMMIILHFATTTPPILIIDGIFIIRNVKIDDNSSFCDDFRL